MTDQFKLTPTQQAAAVERIAQNVALLSGAGCGKTFVLARRFAELLRARVGQPDALRRLVAVTFTEKAALEMAQRVRLMLGEFATEAEGAERAQLLDWLDELPEARISTIHGFCAALLRNHAIDAGIDPGFAVGADTLFCGALADEAVDETVLAAVEAGEAPLLGLLANQRYDQVVEHVRELLDCLDAWASDDYSDPAATLARWDAQRQADGQRAWDALAEDESFVDRLRRLAEVPCSDAGDKLAVRRVDVLAAIEAMLADPAARTPEALAATRKSPGNVGSAKAWGDKETLMSVRAAIKDIQAELETPAVYAQPPGPADTAAAEGLAVLCDLARRAGRQYDRKKQARGLLDFTDLLTCTHRLLRDRPDVRHAVAAEIDQILIDECQDTDAVQMDLLGMLADPEQTRRPTEGRVFVVGDAKQSIYRFRGAQVEVFEDLCGRLGPGAKENLDQSFRTHARGLAFVNDLFARLMGPAYEPIHAHREEVPPDASVEILLAEASEDYPLDSAAGAQRAQAALAAECIRRMLDDKQPRVWDEQAETWRPVRPGDIAVLMARMTHSLEYEREFQRRGIDYYVVAGTGFFQQQEVYDILNALAVIDNPFDDVALIGTLRSALVGLDDNVLMHLALTHQTPYLPDLSPDRLADRIDEAAHHTLAWAAGLLRRLHRRKDALGIDGVLSELLDETGYEAVLLAQPPGRRMVGNVRLLRDRARAADTEGVGIAAFLAQMRDLVLQEARYEQAAVAAEEADVVRLMTIHKAKGLEFPVVLVPDLNAGRTGRTGPVLHRTDWGLTWRPPAPAAGVADAEDAADPVSWQAARLAEREDDRLEDLRQYYVALTRHRDHLVLIGADRRRSDDTFDARGSWLWQTDAVLDLRGTLDSGQCDVAADDGGVAYRVAACAPSPPAPGKRRSQPAARKILTDASDPPDVARRIRALADQRLSDPPLLGPLDAGAGRVELAVTALNDFATCPMLYRWRHELRVPSETLRATAAAPAAEGRCASQTPPAPASDQASPASGPMEPLDPATLGTLLHRCMERLDLVSPQPAAALLAEAAEHIGLPDADLAAFADEFRAMRDTFLAHPLCEEIRRARTDLRELDFLADAAPAMLRGQIDLLCEQDDRTWHVIDYKSDRVRPQTLAEHAERYELQLLLYAAAAQRHTGQDVRRATLYFLRLGQTYEFDLSEERLADARARAGQAGRDLILARRRREFPRHTTPTCRVCPYAVLCDSADDEAPSTDARRDR